MEKLCVHYIFNSCKNTQEMIAHTAVRRRTTTVCVTLAKILNYAAEQIMYHHHCKTYESYQISHYVEMWVSYSGYFNSGAHILIFFFRV